MLSAFQIKKCTPLIFTRSLHYKIRRCNAHLNIERVSDTLSREISVQNFPTSAELTGSDRISLEKLSLHLAANA